jgi:hypothetical protein
MSPKRVAVACILVFTASICTADAQSARTSSWDRGTALTPQQHLYVFRHKSAERCRELCLDDKRCTSWTHLDKWEGFCYTGIGVKERQPDPDITSGEIKE